MNTMRKARFGKVWRFEQLEDRRMLSVSAVLNRGDLLIRGSDAAEEISVEQREDGAWVVTGWYGTSILDRDGIDEGNDFKVIEGVSRDVIIRMGGGNDIVDIWPYDEEARVVVPRDLRVEMGAGENWFAMYDTDVVRDAIFRNIGELNEVFLWDSDIGRDVRIQGRDGMDRNYFQYTDIGRDLNANLGRGADLIAFADGDVGRDVRVNLGGGGGNVEWNDGQVADFLGYDDYWLEGDNVLLANVEVVRDVNVRTSTRVGDVAAVWVGSPEDEGLVLLVEGVRSKIERDVRVTGGRGADSFEIYRADVGRDVRASMGAGDDYTDIWYTNVVRNVNVNMGSGDDVFYLDDSTVEGRVQVNLGNGENWAGIWDAIVIDNLNLRSGGGDDFVDVWKSTIGGSASFNLGGGDDELWMEHSSANQLSVNLGAGDDDLYVRNNQANRVSLNGGRGYDRLFDGGNNPPANPVGFEEFLGWPWSVFAQDASERLGR